MIAAAGCGSKSPAGPTSNGSQNNFTPGPLASVPVYVGQVQLSTGATGTLLLRPSAVFAAVTSKRPEIVNVILDLFGATLHAQGSAASGELILPTGVIDLTGTYTGSTFSVSGGGYALTAAESGGSLSGTGTAPEGGNLTVSPPAPPNAAPAPAPSDASGTYKVTYSVTTPEHARSTSIATGAIAEDCNYSIVMSGTLTLQLQSSGSGTYAARLVDDWSESDGPPGKCDPRLVNTLDPYTFFGGGSVKPVSPQDLQARVSASVVQFAWVNGDRAATISGVVSGASVVVRYSRTRAWSRPRGTFLYSTAFSQGIVDLTLIKQ
jgi:hypothetical protein